MKIRFTPRAFADREQIFEYLVQRSPVGARNVLTSLGDAVTLLSEQPLAGHATDVSGVRVIFVGRYPYKIFYRMRADAIEVLHIRHTSRRPTNME